MAILRFKGVGIKAMAACVPSHIVSNESLKDIMPKEEVDKIIQSVGIYERRITDEKTMASDLCYEAAEKLIADNDIDKESIDMLLFMSQVSDYRIPATSCILQHRLGLSKDCAAMDLSLACSGYVYALSTAMAFASLPGIDRVLLLDGEALTKIVNPLDKVNVPLYGDAGTATLIEKGDFEESIFVLHSDGSGEDAVKVPAGMRHPISQKSLEITERENGNFRSDLEIYMDGMDVFNFAIKVVPKDIKHILSLSDNDVENLDYVVFHQSNRFMTDFFVKKLKLNPEKVPYSISKYGNTSSASIPLTIVSELKEKNTKANNVVISGFGAGLSWATGLLSLKDCNISEIIEL